jgi:hypothetical protein
MFPGLAILFWLLIALASLVVGSTLLLVHGVRDGSRPRAAAGAAILACLGGYAAWAHVTKIDEWNPAHVRTSDVVGTWKAGESRLEFFADGRFRVRASGGAARRIGMAAGEGTWTLFDYNLTLHSRDGAVHELRVVMEGGAYRIIEQPGDLDGWMAWRGFHRTSPRPTTTSRPDRAPGPRVAAYPSPHHRRTT